MEIHANMAGTNSEIDEKAETTVSHSANWCKPDLSTTMINLNRIGINL